MCARESYIRMCVDRNEMGKSSLYIYKTILCILYTQRLIQRIQAQIVSKKRQNDIKQHTLPSEQE